jgi:hypothetical protein
MKWDKLLGTYNQPKLNQEDINQINSPISCNEIETIQCLPTKKSPWPDGFKAKFYQTFNKKLTPILLFLRPQKFDQKACRNHELF